jgi:hypothetical protein
MFSLILKAMKASYLILLPSEHNQRNHRTHLKDPIVQIGIHQFDEIIRASSDIIQCKRNIRYVKRKSKQVNLKVCPAVSVCCRIGPSLAALGDDSGGCVEEYERRLSPVYGTPEGRRRRQNPRGWVGRHLDRGIV